MVEDAPGKQPADQEKNPEVEETRTTIDALLELLKARGRSELNSIAISLNVDPRIVESWAKVLESGNLIKITYEVGKMYLEPITLSVDQQADVKVKTDVSKYILEEDLAVERISLEKFSKNIDSINSTIGGIEKLYQQKMPDVQRVLAEIDKAYAPIEFKKKSMDKVKEEAEKGLIETSKRIDSLYAKLNSFSPAKAQSDISDKLVKFNAIIENMDNAQDAMTEIGKTKTKFFADMEKEIDTQIKDLKQQLNASKSNIDQGLKANARQLSDVIKSIREQVAVANQLSKEVEGYRKEFERSKRNLDQLKSNFNDKYERLRESMIKDTKIVETQSKVVEQGITTLKQTIGDVSSLDNDIKRWKKNMADVTREVASTRSEILKLTNQLNVIQSDKNMTVERKAKSMEEIIQEGKKTKDKVGKVKKVISDTTEEMRRRAEGKK